MGSSGSGLHAKLNTRFTPLTGASTPSIRSRSMPAWTLLPSVQPFPPLAPSVIHPRLLNVFGDSIPIKVKRVGATYGACVPDPGRTVLGDIGAGLSPVKTL